MKAEAVKSIIQAELPKIVKTDPEIQDLVLDLARAHFASKEETESRFDRVMNRMERDRQEQRRQWDAWIAEDRRKWDKYIAETEKDREEQRQLWAEYKAEREKDREEQQQLWAENKAEREKDREEQQQLWAENKAEREKDREEYQQFLAENRRQWDEHKAQQDQLWAQYHIDQEKSRQETRQLIKDSFRKVDSRLGALGARWGIQSEASFRNGLKAILEESFGVTVENYLSFDEEGKVFGRPDQIELDVIIRNGHLILCEIKSSMSRSDIYTFSRKADFYEAQQNRQANRRLVISPMVEAKALETAESLNIEVYTFADEIEGL